MCIFRPLPDCPDVEATDPAAEARRWLLSKDAAVRDANPTYVEITNECNYDVLYLAQFWNEFIVESVRFAQVLGWPPLVAITFGPGYPTESWHLDLIGNGLRAIRDSGGALGLHAYSIDRKTLCDGDDWLSYRHRRTYRKLQEMGLGDLKLALTEVGQGWGNEPVNVADFACWYRNVKNDPMLILVAFWNAGFTATWPNSNLNGHMLDLARALIAS